MENQAKKFIRCGVHLPVKDLRATIDYYRDSLGFTDEWIFGTRDGGIRRDELRILFAEDPEFSERINGQGNRLPLLWFVENIESVYQEFKERKITIADPLHSHPYGLREFAFVDINGYYIRVAEQE